MNKRIKDITGQRFTRLIAVRYEGDGFWMCLCDCGKITLVKGKKLRSGHTKSCSCWSVDRIAALNRVDRYGGICACGDHAFSVLTRGYVTLVSPEDAEMLSKKSWNAHRSKSGGWSVTGTHAKKLHREILGETAAGKVVDHRSGNPFDNRRDNLRPCDNADNVKNQKLRRATTRGKKMSSFKGVAFNPRNKTKPWMAQIGFDGQHRSLGSYATEREAALAYDAAARELHGEFAKTNADLGLL